MYIGIDLGGTNIAVGIVDEDAKIIAKGSTPTYNERDYQEIVKDMADLANELIKKAGISVDDIKGIGIGTPGSVDAKNGVVVYANNLKFNNVPLRAELSKYFNVPIAVENDANAAALGEYKAAGVKSDCFVAVTLGTGVGSGIVI